MQGTRTVSLNWYLPFALEQSAEDARLLSQSSLLITVMAFSDPVAETHRNGGSETVR
jgi:hypothetical protein